MLGDPDAGSVTERLSDLIWERFGFLAPLWVVKRPETLTIVDYRPTLMMFLSVAGFLFFGTTFVFLFIKFGMVDSFGFWAIGLIAAGCLIPTFRSTIRETYFFDKTRDSYAFVRQFIHRKEVIEGSMSQFTGAYVKTQRNEDTNCYYVILKQEGMFLTGVNEQTLREELPIFNSFDNEADIANAISEFLSTTRQVDHPSPAHLSVNES